MPALKPKRRVQRPPARQGAAKKAKVAITRNGPYIVSGGLKVDWALRVDTLTAVMLVVIEAAGAALGFAYGRSAVRRLA